MCFCFAGLGVPLGWAPGGLSRGDPAQLKPSCMCLGGAFVGSMFLFCGVHAVVSCVAVQGYGAQMVICSGHWGMVYRD